MRALIFLGYQNHVRKSIKRQVEKALDWAKVNPVRSDNALEILNAETIPKSHTTGEVQAQPNNIPASGLPLVDPDLH
jgi:hypothetical protein